MGWEYFALIFIGSIVAGIGLLGGVSLMRTISEYPNNADLTPPADAIRPWRRCGSI